MNKLLTRKQFREFCLERDNFKCVVCKDDCDNSPHHLINNNLFKQPHELGGYFVDNGVTLCNDCHYKAEFTLISVEDLRKFARITNIILPDHFEIGVKYDCWGNEILSNGQRLKGELFDDTGCQKALKEGNVLVLFTNYVKYGRTYHCSWSEKLGVDDKILHDLRDFENKRIIVSTKIDGQNCSLYNDYLHARSLSEPHHESQNLLKQFHASIKNDIPKNWRICLENCFAQHTISYKNLKSYFQVYSIWDDKNFCLNWEETKEYCELLGLETVDVIYDGIFNLEVLKKLYKPFINNDPCEGWVCRLAESFHYSKFQKSCFKFVSKNFIINSNEHWRDQKIIKNELRK